MKKIFAACVFCLFAAVAAADEASDAYQSAHDCYVRLKMDDNAQKIREPWEKCIEGFRRVSEKYGRTASGIDAKFSIGRLYEGLARNSKNKADFMAAIESYQSFARMYPRSNMADDAYYAIGKLYWEKFQDKERAKKSLLKVIKFYKDGDMAGEAKRLLETIESNIPIQEQAIPEVAENLVIVIDPGHGGSDSGAIGASKTEEKDVTLEISKKLADSIKKDMKNASVFLTRNKDSTLTLAERVKFANMKGADIFISVHANASTSKKERGVQTYYLNNATDSAAERLAKQENKYAGRNTSDLEKIIATMIQNASTDESRELARAVHGQLVKGLSGKYSGIADQKVRSALFHVLVGVKCPSILVETSYVSNPKEAARLRNGRYQSLIANSISAGVSKHLKVKKTAS